MRILSNNCEPGLVLSEGKHPFEVYASVIKLLIVTRDYDDHEEELSGQTIYISQDFCLMNLLSSRVSKKVILIVT